MPILIWGGMAIAGLAAGGYALDKASEAADSATTLTKWVVIGGVAYLVAKQAKVIK